MARGLLPNDWTEPPSAEKAAQLAQQIADKDIPNWNRSTPQRFEARNTTSGWRFAYGNEIKGPGTRSKGLARRTGWAVTCSYPHSNEPDAVVDVFPDIVVIHVFDDGEISAG